MDIYIFFSESQLCLGIGVARREAAWMRADSRDYRFGDPFSFYIFDLCKEGETNCLSFFAFYGIWCDAFFSCYSYAV